MTRVRQFDLICVGRAAVDLYAEQAGCGLESARSFRKSLGGSPANVAVGAARQGLRVAMLSRVGDEPMGRFVREALEREGVDVGHVRIDPHRRTGLVLAAARDGNDADVLFFRDNCADMALSLEDFDADFIANARALLVTGTHFSTPAVEAVSRAAVRLAKEAGTRVVLDVDFRPSLWDDPRGCSANTPHADGRATHAISSIVGDCDLVVGTEEEIGVAGGSTDIHVALRNLRERTNAILVVKRGERGAAVFEGDIDDRTRHDDLGAFAVDVKMALGAGDAFIAGFLRGWLASEPLERCRRFGNAMGALVASRRDCAPAMPTRIELDRCLAHVTPGSRIDRDPEVGFLHRATTRSKSWPELHVLALDHRWQLEALGAPMRDARSRIARLKALIAEGAVRGSQSAGSTCLGLIVDDTFGHAVLSAMRESGHWIARPIEISDSVPLAFEHEPNVELALRDWPASQIVKCLVRYPEDMTPADRVVQHDRLLRLYGACVDLERTLILEALPTAAGRVDAPRISAMVEEIYALGLRPDWWKLPAPSEGHGFDEISRIVEANDPYCRGVLLLGHDASLDAMKDAFRMSAGRRYFNGFAIGRAIFWDAAVAWFAGRSNDDHVIEDVATRFASTVDAWRSRGVGGERR